MMSYDDEDGDDDDDGDDDGDEDDSIGFVSKIHDDDAVAVVGDVDDENRWLPSSSSSGGS